MTQCYTTTEIKKQFKGGQEYEIFALVALYKQSFTPQQ